MFHRFVNYSLLIMLAVLVSSCAPAKKKPEQLLKTSNNPVTLAQAVNISGKHLVKEVLSDRKAKNWVIPVTIVVNRFLDHHDYREIEESRRMVNMFAALGRKHVKTLRVTPRSKNSKGHYYIDGEMKIATHPVTKKPTYRLHSRVTEIRTKKVLASAKVWIVDQKNTLSSKPVSLNKAIMMSNNHMLKLIREDRKLQNKYAPATVSLNRFTDGYNGKGIVADREISRTLQGLGRKYKSGDLRIVPKKGNYVISGKIYAKQHSKLKKKLYKLESVTRDVRTRKLVASSSIWIADHKDITYKSKKVPFRQALTNASNHLLAGVYKDRVFQNRYKPSKVVVRPLIDGSKFKQVVANKQLTQAMTRTSYATYRGKLQVQNGTKKTKGDYYIEGKTYNNGKNSIKISFAAREGRTHKVVANADVWIEKRKVEFKPTGPVSFHQATTQSSAHIIDSIHQHRLFNSGAGKAKVVINPFVDINSLDEVDASELVSRIFMNTAKKKKNLTVEVLSRKTLKGSHYIIQGYISLEVHPQRKKKLYRIQSVTREIKTGKIIATADAWIGNKKVAYKPTPEYRDRPVYPPTSPQGYIMRLKELKKPKSSNILSQELKISAKLNDAGRLYGKRQYRKAYAIYKAVEGKYNAEGLRIYAGLYLTNLRLGKVPQAEVAFHNLIKWSLRSGSTLSTKFLFSVSSTKFAGDAFLQKQYGLWLKNIGAYLGGARKCFTVVGHSSRTGAEAYNKKLSKQRAEAIIEGMKPFMKGQAARLRSSGRGYDQNISGLGTDDFRDAIDRRVEIVKGGC